MSSAIPYTTLYRQPGQRCISSNTALIGLAIAYAVVSLGIFVSTDSSRIFLGGPLVVFLVWRYGTSRTEKIFFFIQCNTRNDMSYGYMDSDKQRKGDLPIDEYSNWYTEHPSPGKMKTYMLYVMIRNVGQVIYLKEELKSETPPEGWNLTEEVIENKTGVFLVPGLRTLILEMDKHSQIESTTESAMLNSIKQ